MELRAQRGRMTTRVMLLALPALWSAGVVQQVHNASRPTIAQRRAARSLPLTFEKNRGQTDARVEFVARGRHGSLFLLATEAVLRLRDSVLRTKLVGANPEPRLSGAGRLPGRVNSYAGNDPSRWRTNIPAYRKVRCREVYPGVDLVYYGKGGELEYDFVVAPGRAPGDIGLRFEGADEIGIDEQGDLVLRCGEDEIRHRKPVVYQEAEGVREPVEGQYVLRADGAVGFDVGAYDARRSLVIDPVLVYSTYLGGAETDFSFGITVDSNGNAYVSGYTASVDFPTQDPEQPSPVDSFDAFVLKLNPSGQLVYSTFLGGTGADFGTDMDTDAAGDLYVVGFTLSADFPVLFGFQPDFGGADNTVYGDLFIAKFSPVGTLEYSTYFGGPRGEQSLAIAVNAAGYAHVAGLTEGDLPVGNAVQPTFGGGAMDAFVAKIAPDGTELVWATYLGGSNADEAWDVAVDDQDGVYIAGSTRSDDYPVLNPLSGQGHYHGGAPYTPQRPTYGDGIVTKINGAGTAVVYSTYLGGSSLATEYCRAIAVDKDRNVIVTGTTGSSDFPLHNPIQDTLKGPRDAFVTKINAAGDGLVFSTFLGGEIEFDVDREEGGTVEVDAFGNIYVFGVSGNTDFPLVDAVQSIFAGGWWDTFLTKFNPDGSQILFSTYLGGSNLRGDQLGRTAADDVGNAYLTGATDALDFPIVNAYQPDYGGGLYDAFVTKLGPPDSDGDGLLDEWESAGGYTHPNGEFVPLPGADPLHKDIYVEIDYMTGYQPGTDFQAVKDAFAASPVANPDGVDGITLHVFVDEEIALQSPLGSGDSGDYDWSEFDSLKAAHFLEERGWVFRYCLFAEEISAGTSGIARGIESSDFIVSLGAWGGGTTQQQLGTFMHELGHTLGLRHGGGDDLDHKPNYLSIMNRRFQLTGLSKSGQPHLDYSRWKLEPLDEAALDESVGLDGPTGDPDFAALQTMWQSYFRTVLSHGTVGPIDWDSDLDVSNTENPCVPNPDIPGFLSVDLNGDNALTALQGFDDWAALIFTGGAISGEGIGLPPETPLDGLTYEEAQAETPPPDLKLKAHASRKKIKLTWKPAVPRHGGRSSCRKGSRSGRRAVSYVVYRLEDGQPQQQLGTSGTSNFTDKSVVSGTTYSYLVSVVTDGIEGQPHGPATVTAK